MCVQRNAGENSFSVIQINTVIDSFNDCFWLSNQIHCEKTYLIKINRIKTSIEYKLYMIVTQIKT